eukprot:UN01377
MPKKGANSVFPQHAFFVDESVPQDVVLKIVNDGVKTLKTITAKSITHAVVGSNDTDLTDFPEGITIVNTDYITYKLEGKEIPETAILRQGTSAAKVTAAASGETPAKRPRGRPSKKALEEAAAKAEKEAEDKDRR